MQPGMKRPPLLSVQIHFVEIDIEKDPQIAENAGVNGTPTVQVAPPPALPPARPPAGKGVRLLVPALEAVVQAFQLSSSACYIPYSGSCLLPRCCFLPQARPLSTRFHPFSSQLLPGPEPPPHSPHILPPPPPPPPPPPHPTHHHPPHPPTPPTTTTPTPPPHPPHTLPPSRTTPTHTPPHPTPLAVLQGQGDGEEHARREDEARLPGSDRPVRARHCQCLSTPGPPRGRVKRAAAAPLKRTAGQCRGLAAVSCLRH